MKLVTIDLHNVAFQNTDHDQFGNVTGLWSRSTFGITFGITIPAGLKSMAYEPDRSLYVYSLEIDSPIILSSPSEYATMNEIHNNLNTIENTTISGLYPAYDFDGESWSISSATQSGLDWDSLRSTRDSLLSATDFFMTVDYYNDKMTGQEQTDVKNYREALRDLPANTLDPANPTWPNKPQIVIDNEI